MRERGTTCTKSIQRRSVMVGSPAGAPGHGPPRRLTAAKGRMAHPRQHPRGRPAAATPATSRPTPSSIRSTTSRLKERASRDAALPTAPPFSDPIDAEGNEYYDTGKATGFRTGASRLGGEGLPVRRAPTVPRGRITSATPGVLRHLRAPAVYSECAHCLATDDRLTMVECAACHVTRHVHCLRRALADTEHFEDEVGRGASVPCTAGNGRLNRTSSAGPAAPGLGIRLGSLLQTETQRWRCSDCEDGITNAVAGLDVAQWPGLASQDDSGVRILRARRGAANDVELLLWNGSVADASRHAWVPARQLADCTHLLAQVRRLLGGPAALRCLALTQLCRLRSAPSVATQP